MTSGPQFSFCPELARLYSDGFGEGADGSHIAATGCSTPNNLATLKGLYEHMAPRRTLEVGLCLGGSALLFTALFQDSGVAPEGQHIALDPFQTSVWKRAGLLAIERAGLSSYLDFREKSSSLELPRLVEEGQRFDIVYIDGSHLVEDVFVDAFFSARLLTEDGVVVFDDSTDPHVRKVLKFLRTNCSYGLENIDLGRYRPDGRTVTHRLARMFGKAQMTAFRRIGPVERPWDASFRSF